MPGLARPSAGEHLPRPSTRCYGRLTQALRRPVEPAQYAAEPYRKVLRRHGIRQSMSRKGNCYDNAPMESFFGSLKTELVHRTAFPTREAAKRAIFEYVEAFYYCCVTSETNPLMPLDNPGRVFWPEKAAESES